MKNVVGVLIIGVALLSTSCKKKLIESNEQKADDIVYEPLDITLSGVSELSVQIPYDERLNFRFSIMDIKAMNDNWDESNTDTLAADVSVNHVQILDDSKFGYLNALDADAEINPNSGYWNNRTDPDNYLLSTSWGAEFKGAGDKYLAFRLQKDGGYIYGWFLVNCTEKSDELQIKGYAYNKTVSNPIQAGEQ
tara:strand:- start:8252 stop:8830 length:579 start_codon:yes stop_codon:yes gene_type:complete